MANGLGIDSIPSRLWILEMSKERRRDHAGMECWMGMIVRVMRHQPDHLCTQIIVMNHSYIQDNTIR
jgi:hypothetical protein